MLEFSTYDERCSSYYHVSNQNTYFV